MGYTARFETALAFAARLHNTQNRKGVATPYIGHLLGVASLVIEHGGDEDEAIAALLHDAIEDQGGAATGEVIRRMFGEKVHHIVNGCTDCEDTGKVKPPWKPRKQAYLDHLKTADASTRLVSCADKLYNSRTILDGFREVGMDVFKRFTPGAKDTLWYYRSLADEFLRAGPAALAAELNRVVSELERLSSVDTAGAKC